MKPSTTMSFLVHQELKMILSVPALKHCSKLKTLVEIKNEVIATSEFEVIGNKSNDTSGTAQRETSITDTSKMEETHDSTFGFKDLDNIQNDTSKIDNLESNITGISKNENMEISTVGVDPIRGTLNVSSEKEEKESNFSTIKETEYDTVGNENFDNPINNTPVFVALDWNQNGETENSSTIQVDVDNNYYYNIYINPEISIEDLEILQNVNSKTSEIEISDQDCDEDDDDEKSDDE